MKDSKYYMILTWICLTGGAGVAAIVFFALSLISSVLEWRQE
jgi:hypothetical protein